MDTHPKNWKVSEKLIERIKRDQANNSHVDPVYSALITNWLKLGWSKLDITYNEVSPSYAQQFLISSNLKVLYWINEGTDTVQLRSELDKVLLNSLYIDVEVSSRPNWDISKDIRNVLISDSAVILTFIRQGILDLRDLDFIIFEPCKLPFGQQNHLEPILHEYIAQSKVSTRRMPKIYLVLNAVEEIDFHSTNKCLQKLGLSNVKLIKEHWAITGSSFHALMLLIHELIGKHFHRLCLAISLTLIFR